MIAATICEHFIDIEAAGKVLVPFQTTVKEITQRISGTRATFVQNRFPFLTNIQPRVIFKWWMETSVNTINTKDMFDLAIKRNERFRM